MYSRKKVLMRWGSIAGIIAFCGVAWCIAGVAPKSAAAGVNPKQPATAQKSAEPTPLHDEVQYLVDKPEEASRAL